MQVKNGKNPKEKQPLERASVGDFNVLRCGNKKFCADK